MSNKKRALLAKEVAAAPVAVKENKKTESVAVKKRNQSGATNEEKKRAQSKKTNLLGLLLQVRRNEETFHLHPKKRDSERNKILHLEKRHDAIRNHSFSLDPKNTQSHILSFFL